MYYIINTCLLFFLLLNSRDLLCAAVVSWPQFVAAPLSPCLANIGVTSRRDSELHCKRQTVGTCLCPLYCVVPRLRLPPANIGVTSCRGSSLHCEQQTVGSFLCPLYCGVLNLRLPPANTGVTYCRG